MVRCPFLRQACSTVQSVVSTRLDLVVARELELVIVREGVTTIGTTNAWSLFDWRPRANCSFDTIDEWGRHFPKNDPFVGDRIAKLLVLPTLVFKQSPILYTILRAVTPLFNNTSCV